MSSGFCEYGPGYYGGVGAAACYPAAANCAASPWWGGGWNCLFTPQTGLVAITAATGAAIVSCDCDRARNALLVGAATAVASGIAQSWCCAPSPCYPNDCRYPYGYRSGSSCSSSSSSSHSGSSKHHKRHRPHYKRRCNNNNNNDAVVVARAPGQQQAVIATTAAPYNPQGNLNGLFNQRRTNKSKQRRCKNQPRSSKVHKHTSRNRK
jgi:hypothetical protein